MTHLNKLLQDKERPFLCNKVVSMAFPISLNRPLSFLLLLPHFFASQTRYSMYSLHSSVEFFSVIIINLFPLFYFHFLFCCSPIDSLFLSPNFPCFAQPPILRLSHSYSHLIFSYACLTIYSYFFPFFSVICSFRENAIYICSFFVTADLCISTN